MALEVVGGAFLSASLHVLFADIHSIVHFVRRNKVGEDLLNKLGNKLLLANGVLDDAEKQQITNPNVRNWLEKLKDAVHNAEDLVDVIKTEALRCELEAHRQMGFRVRNFFSSKSKVKDVERRIVKITESVDDIVEDMKRLGLREGVQTRIPFQIQRACLNILEKESDVYGRDAEKEAIMKFLLSGGDEEGGPKISVMPIVGMGGIGKTTLAQLVYMDVIDGKVDMKKPFDIKEWITVADESKCDVFTLTKEIYEKVTKSKLDDKVKETFLVQRDLKDALKGKKFLFVLDDVWNVDHQTWNNLKKPFESAAKESKIIVTTRLPQIAKDLATADSEVLDLTLLSEADCWKLFSKHAFNNQESSSYPHLEEIGRKIVERCRGNPLAVKSLASLLHPQLNPKEWQNVLENDIWKLEQKEGDILPALWLSYYYLPRHLKRCFAYCSIIPKDYQFDKGKLILLWMAENLLQPQNNMTLEEVGEKYFEDLSSRSLFLVDESGKFTMHDVVNDLAKSVSGDSFLRLDDNCSGNVTRKTCHISQMQYRSFDDIEKKLKDLSENKVLRTILVDVEAQQIINPKLLRSMQYLRVFSFKPRLGGGMKWLESIRSLKHLRYLDLSNDWRLEEIPHTICKLYNLQTLRLVGCGNLTKLPDSIGNLKNLRYLNLSYTAIGKIPDTICNLHDLRYLNLSGTPIVEIPDAICNLHELRTLSLEDCEKLTRLPTKITMLTNLCTLKIEWTIIKEMPPKLSNLKNLQELPEFVVGRSYGIEELGGLRDLHGGLHIRSLENVEEVEDVSKADLKNKKDITDLRLEWNDSSDVSHDKAREVLDRLQPHPNIEDLRISNYGGRIFPDWIGHHSFSCIRNLILEGCKNCDRLPPLGELPSLEELNIFKFDMLERIGDEFYLNDSASPSQSFKSLEVLRIRGMGEWKEWSSVGGAFPNLKELCLSGCPKLKGECLPDLPSLEELQIYDDQHVVASLSRCQFPSLRSLRISNCGGMKSFPQGRLPSTIKSIVIWGCEDLVSLSEEGWPCPNLNSLSIRGCENLFAHSSNKWNLGMLTSLTYLGIEYLNMEGVDSFPEEEGQFPTTLTSLHLGELGNIKSLNWTALRHLTSLQSLRIHNCPQLQCLGEERLPASLSELTIYGCPLLKPRCQRGIGQDWHNIQHIPNIIIDDQRI